MVAASDSRNSGVHHRLGDWVDVAAFAVAMLVQHVELGPEGVRSGVGRAGSRRRHNDDQAQGLFLAPASI